MSKATGACSQEPRTKIFTKGETPRIYIILIKGVERSEQNNPVSCFVNGDRRILRDVTSDQIQNIEQNSRTTPLKRRRKKPQKGLFLLVDHRKRGVERSSQNNPVSCFVNGDRRILRRETKEKRRTRGAKYKNDSPRVHQKKAHICLSDKCVLFSTKSAFVGINPLSWMKSLRDEILLRKVKGGGFNFI